MPKHRQLIKFQDNIPYVPPPLRVSVPRARLFFISPPRPHLYSGASMNRSLGSWWTRGSRSAPGVQRLIWYLGGNAQAVLYLGLSARIWYLGGLARWSCQGQGTVISASAVASPCTAGGEFLSGCVERADGFHIPLHFA